MPHVCCCVFSKHEEVRQHGMNWQRVVLETLLEAQQYIETNDNEVATSVAQALKDVQFHEWQVVLECLAAGQQSNWCSNDPEVRDIAFSLFGSPPNTKWSCEDVFSHLASITERQTKGVNKLNKSLRCLPFVGLLA